MMNISLRTLNLFVFLSSEAYIFLFFVIEIIINPIIQKYINILFCEEISVYELK